MTGHPPPIARIIARACTEGAFRRTLIADPVATLRSDGIGVPDGVTVTVVEDTPARIHLVLPAETDGALSDEELGGITGGLSVTYGTSTLNKTLLPLGPAGS